MDAGLVLTRKVLLVKYSLHLRQCKRLYARKLILLFEASFLARVTYRFARAGSFDTFFFARSNSLIISALAVPCSILLNLLDITFSSTTEFIIVAEFLLNTVRIYENHPAPIGWFSGSLQGDNPTKQNNYCFSY